jgi:excisionase family DNA binding protein
MLSVKEAAKILCVENQTVRNYIRTGIGKDKEKLKAIQVKHGARTEYRIKNDDFDNYRKKLGI